MASKQTIADVKCSRMRFEDGDRVLVRMYQPVSAEAVERISRMIRKWAGADVQVLVINAFQMDVQPESRCQIKVSQ